MSPVTSHRDPGLLEAFLEQAVTDDYADVTPNVDGGSTKRGHWRAVPATLLIGLIVVIAVISTRSSADERQQTRDALVARVTSTTEVVTEQQARVDAQSVEVEALRQRLLEAGSATSRVDEVTSLADAAGTVALSGPGLRVTIDDAADAEAGSLNRVLDRDLQDIVNALWQMGAAGIAVNGERLTGATAIRGAGDAILVNYEPLTRPYVVSAVGTTTTGGEDSGLDRLLASLSDDYGLVSQVATGDVALPAGEVRSSRFASVESEGPQQ